MVHNNKELPRYARTAGKITIVTAVAGLLVFMFAFVFDVGKHELNRVSAQTASTTLTVLNTPPTFTTNPYEVVESSTSTPTNSGDDIQWAAVGSDSNSAPYFLLICSTNATPTANAASGPGNLGTAPPACSPTSTIQWGVSAATPSGNLATVSTTTTEGGLFSTSSPNVWYAWVCDDDPDNPRCNDIPLQGTGVSPTSSPFHVNSRPVLTDFYNGGPFDPGDTATFFSTSSDPDTLGGDQDIYLVVCQAVGWATSTNTCYDPDDFLASTTVSVQDDATASFTLDSVLQDGSYFAYGYIVDQHGHEALANPINQNYLINNVAPYALNAEISLNGGSDLIVTNPGGETTGFTLDFTVRDDNGCATISSTTDEIQGYYVSVFRNGVGTSSCDATVPDYDANSCYTNGVATTTWDLDCTQTNACLNMTQNDIDYSCTFPLWFVADPTVDTGTSTLPAFLSSDYWTAGIIGYDNGFATGTIATTSSSVDLYPLTALDVLAYDIVYGAIEPGSNNPSLSATSTVISLGNTGIDQEVTGDSMCDYYTTGSTCNTSATSTVPEWRQQFSSTSESYDTDATYGGGSLDPLIRQLSSSTPEELELNVQKATTTSIGTVTRGTTYWGIAVPGSITKAGAYTGLNTFTAVTAEPGDWY